MTRRLSSTWARRGILAAVLIGAAVIPGHAASSASRSCAQRRCGTAGAIRWVRRLPGAWTAQSGPGGTVLSIGQAHAAAGGNIAAVGLGLTIYGYDAGTGAPLWTTTLDSLPAGASIASVRAWQSVVTAGVTVPRAGAGALSRLEVVLAARTGQRIRAYPAAVYGGAVAAGAARSVIVGTRSVTSYDNATGKVIWSRPTGRIAQAWRVDSGELYVTMAAGGYLGTAPVTALWRISLRTGARRVIRPAHGFFAGTLSGAADGEVLFSAASGLSAYSGDSGRLLWQRPGVVLDTMDLARQTLYVTVGSTLIGIDPRTGRRIRHTSVPGSSGVYGVRDGVALGLDQGARGVAWGYDVARRRVIWTTAAVPWPHYFVDLSGLGGSADPASGVVLLTSCAKLGTASASGSGRVCLRPELVAIRR
jgi:outer membrane protein assembly factor BamB